MIFHAGFKGPEKSVSTCGRVPRLDRSPAIACPWSCVYYEAFSIASQITERVSPPPIDDNNPQRSQHIHIHMYIGRGWVCEGDICVVSYKLWLAGH